MRASWAPFAAVWLVLAQAAMQPAVAAACTVLADEVYAYDTPVDGLLIVTTHCNLGGCYAGSLPSELPVVDTVSGETVPGMIVQAAGDLERDVVIAWRPDQALIEGHSYQVTWQPELVLAESVDLSFEALPALNWTADDLVVMPSLFIGAEADQVATCEQRGTDMCFGGPLGPATIRITQKGFVGLSASVELPGSPFGAYHLYRARAAFWRSGETPPALVELDWLWRTIATHAFYEVADEYCFRLELTSLVDGSVAMHEACVPHGSLGAFSSGPVPESELEHALGVCTRAPAGLERLWCNAWTVRCAQSAPAAPCQTLEATCASLAAASTNADAGARPLEAPHADQAPEAMPMQMDMETDGENMASSDASPTSAAAGCSAGARPAARGHAVLALLLGVLVCRARRPGGRP